MDCFLCLCQSAEVKNETLNIVHLDQSKYWLPEVSNVFHGRDIFAPVAAHLASGIPLSSLGTSISDPVRIEYSHANPHLEGLARSGDPY